MIPEFSDLWLPFEAQIQALCARDSSPHSSRSDGISNQAEARRWLVQKLFESDNVHAQEAVTAFETVLQAYIDETQRRLETGFYDQRSAEITALEFLSTDASFLQKANTYTSAFASFVIDFYESGGTIPSYSEHELAKPLMPPAATSQEFVVQTSQEAAALLISMCQGRAGQDWRSNEQAGTRTFERKGFPHMVQIELTSEERDAGVGIVALEDMTRELDADGTLAVLYVSMLLAPPAPLPDTSIVSNWIDLNDIIQKIGWDPRSTQQRLEMRRRVYHYLKFCARANLRGQRNSIYRDPTTGQEIETRIDGPIWRFMKEERSIQPSLFQEDEVPLRVEIAVSREWTRLTTSPSLAQFLPMGELLGAIPPDRATGAWARVLGLALASFWRRQPRAALDGSILPTRRELLSGYVPKVAPPNDVFASNNPRRALEYWHGALQILLEEGFLAAKGEALFSLKEASATLPRKGWIPLWFDGKTELYPGPKIEASIQACANNLPVHKPRNFVAPKRRIGRPTKTKNN